MDPISLSLILLFGGIGYICYAYTLIVCLDDISGDMEAQKREEQMINRWKRRKLQKDYRLEAPDVLKDHTVLPEDVIRLIMNYYDDII